MKQYKIQNRSQKNSQSCVPLNQDQNYMHTGLACAADFLVSPSERVFFVFLHFWCKIIIDPGLHRGMHGATCSKPREHGKSLRQSVSLISKACTLF